MCMHHVFFISLDKIILAKASKLDRMHQTVHISDVIYLQVVVNSMKYMLHQQAHFVA